MATIVARPVDRKASERKFYSRMALFLVFVVLLGFGPSFYLRDIVPPYPRPNPTLPPAVILHGAVFTISMALIIAQTQLIASRKPQVHIGPGIAVTLFAIRMTPVLAGFTVQLLLGLALFVPLFIWDRRSLGHVHPATKFGFGMAAISIAIPLAVFWGNLPWASVAAHLPGVGA